MSQEVRFTISRVLKNNDLGYSVGVTEPLGLYVIEVIDITGNTVGIPGVTSKENPSFAIFGITKEEFDYKDTSMELLDSIAAMLIQALPKDRIIAEQNLRPDGREETIDDGEYVKWRKAELEERQKAAAGESAKRAKLRISEMLKAGEGWYISTKGAGKNIPTVDASGAVQIFTKKEYAEFAVFKAGELPLEVIHADRSGLDRLFSDLHRYGILKVKADALQQNGGEVAREEIIKAGDLSGHALLNSRLNSLIIRYLQAQKLPDEKQAKLLAATLWSALGKDFARGVYFVPVCFEGEEGNARDDGEMHFTERSVQFMKEKKPALIGMDKYKPANGGGKRIKFMALRNKDAEGKSFLPVFTDIVEFKLTFGDRARICMITYDDLYDRHKSFDGTAVNPATLNFVVTPAGIENIQAEKDGPIKVYRNKSDSDAVSK